MDKPKFAHYVKKTDVLEGIVNGKEAEALCGERFVPSELPDKHPVCEKCDAIMSLALAAETDGLTVVIQRPPTNDDLIGMYKAVIDDLKQDIGYQDGAKEKALSVLQTRLNELETIWAIPDELWIDPKEDGKSNENL